MQGLNAANAFPPIKNKLVFYIILLFKYFVRY